jgi:hypothetical protein
MLGRFRGIARGSRALAAGAALLIAGCGDAASGGSELTLRADDGPFEGTLRIEPSPPHVGQHHVVLMLSEDPETGEPLEGATVTLSPWMPAHGHGSTDVEAVEDGPGVYVAENVWLNMPGIWDLRVHVDAEEQGDLIATVEVP